MNLSEKELKQLNKFLEENRKAENKRKRKKEFSKVIVIAVLLAGLYVILYSSFVMYKLNNLDALPVLISAIFVEIASATGFYYWKAKHENVIKINNSTGEYSYEYDVIDEEDEENEW